MKDLKAELLRAFEVFVVGVRTRAKQASDWKEERLECPSRDLLCELMRILGRGGDLNVVPKRTVKIGVDAEERIGDPDFSVYNKAGRLVLCVELKAPHKRWDPRRFPKGHDRDQWERYKRLPNVIYTNGAKWSLWRAGEPEGPVVTVCDDIKDPISDVHVDVAKAERLFRNAFLWEPQPITNSKTLALESANYCRMLRDEVNALPGSLLEGMSKGWRKVLFPDLDESKFPDAYAQTVTFALLTASSLELHMDFPNQDSQALLDLQLHHMATELTKRRSLLGNALGLLTGSIEVRSHLQKCLEMLLVLVASVDWEKMRGSETRQPNDWLHFYEDFLEQYDPAMRRATGSYYTPAGAVAWMTKFTDGLLSSILGKAGGYADRSVTVVDPALGTGTFLLGVMRRIAERVASPDGAGPGAVGHEIEDAAYSRLIGLEIQSGPYAVAQLRLAEYLRSTGAFNQEEDMQVYLADTLSNPEANNSYIPGLEPISRSREAADKVKREKPVVVVIGNPPYLRFGGNKGGWVEDVLLDDWKPPADWGVAAHTKNLSSLYVYFWRWAAWKVFENSRLQGPDNQAGIVCFITPTSFLTGDGFQGMRKWLRKKCSHIWVLHLAPEGHQAPPDHQFFAGMRQPVTIVTAVRTTRTQSEKPAEIKYHRVSRGSVEAKVDQIQQLLNPGSPLWGELAKPGDEVQWRGWFSPKPPGQWGDMPRVEDMLPWHVNGVKVGRKWPISPDPDALSERWRTLIGLPASAKSEHFSDKGDRHIHKKVRDNLTPNVVDRLPIAQETSLDITPVPYGYRSFDRQWIIRDKRVIDRDCARLWAAYSDDHQIHLRVPAQNTDGTRLKVAHSEGIIVSFTNHIPDMDSLSGSRSGRMHPLWRDPQGRSPNIPPALLPYLAETHGTRHMEPMDLLAYIAAVVAHPGYTETYRSELEDAAEIRVPLTRKRFLFVKAVRIGHQVLWLHTHRKRGEEPDIEAEMPSLTKAMPRQVHEIEHDPQREVLIVKGFTADQARNGEVSNVSEEAFNYKVADTEVVDKWFDYRVAETSERKRKKKTTSPLERINPNEWTTSYTDDLVALLRNLTLLTALHAEQRELLNDIIENPLVSRKDMGAKGALPKNTGFSVGPEEYKRQEPRLSERY